MKIKLIKKISIGLISMPIIGLSVSCGTKHQQLQWGGSSFAKEYKKLSYKSDADNAHLINEINYSAPRSNSIYQMLVYAFADGNNDGIGDFIGAKNKLKDLQKLGIDQIWLSPIHPASSYHGYDVIDYTDVAPELGGMKAFNEFVKAAHEKNIKIYLDSVYNHTSYEHPWFQEALKNPNSKYRQYYHFNDKDKTFGDTNLLGEEQVNKFVNLKNKRIAKKSYISKFWGGMPDLNLDNPNVIDELKNVQRFWVKKGIDGFRYDAFVEYFSSKGETQKNFNVNKIFSTLRKAGEKGALENGRSKSFDQFMIGEWWGDALSGQKYFKDGKLRALDTTYDKKHWNDSPIVDISVESMQDIAKKYKATSISAQWTPTLDNHDWTRWLNIYRRDIRGINPSLKNKIDKKDVNAMSTALFSMLTRPGNPIIYQGDELAYHGLRAGGDAKMREAIKWNNSQNIVNFYEKRSGKQERITIGDSIDRPSFEYQINNVGQPAYVVSKVNDWRKKNSFIGQTNSATIEKSTSYIDIDSIKSNGASFIRKDASGTKKFLVAMSFESDFKFTIKNSYIISNKVLVAPGSIVDNNTITLKPNSYIILELK